MTKTFKIKEQLNSIKKNTWEKAEARKRVENFKEKREKILRYKEQTSGYQWVEKREGARQGQGIRRYKLLCIK